MELVVAGGLALLALSGFSNASAAAGGMQPPESGSVLGGRYPNNPKMDYGGAGTPPADRPGSLASQAASFVLRQGDPSHYSFLQRRLDHGDYRGPEGQRLLEHRTSTQWGWDNARLLASQFYQQQPTRQPVPTISYVRNVFSTVPVHMSDEYKEFMRAQEQNTWWPEVPLRGVRADYYPDRERRRAPFFNNPNSVFLGSSVMPVQQTTHEELFHQPPKSPIDNRM